MNRRRPGSWFRAALLASCLAAGGCLIPYAYPKLAYIPGCPDIPGKATDIHAFRVDVAADEIDVGEQGEYTLTEIPLGPDGRRLPPQFALTAERGVYVLGIALNFNAGRVHTTRVRLYAPGYQLVELKPWESVDSIRWERAADFAAEERAVDEILRRPRVTTAVVPPEPFWGLDNKPRELPTVTGPGAETTGVFVFAAGEYERLAVRAPLPSDAARLRAKAAALVVTVPAAGVTPGSP